MGDFLGGLFGGGGSTTTQAPTLTGGQKSLLDALTGLLTPQVGQGITPFQGTRPGEVPFGPFQQQAFGLAGGLAPGIGAGLDLFGQTLGQFDPTQGQGFLGQAQGALQQGLGSDPTQDILKAFEPSRRLALRGFEQDIVPSLLERFGATSGPSGALNQALAEAGAGLELGLSAQTAPFIGQAALQQPGLQLAGAGLGGQLAGVPGQLAQQGAQLGGMSTDLLSQLFNIGGLQQQLPRGIAGAEQARFQEAQPFANPFLNLAPLALGTPAFTNVVQPQGQGLLQSLLPGLGSLLGQEGGASTLLGNLGSLGSGVSGLFGGGGGSTFGNPMAVFGAPGVAGPAAGGAGGLMGGIGNLAGGIGGLVQGLLSDKRLKENIEPIKNALDKVKGLSGKTYHYTFSPEQSEGGIIAQDLERVLPEAVVEINGIKLVKYEAVIALLVNAVNELSKKVG